MSERVTEWGPVKFEAICILGLCMAFSGCCIGWGLSGNANNSPVRCDCRHHRCDDGDSGGVVLDSRIDTEEVRR